MTVIFFAGLLGSRQWTSGERKRLITIGVLFVGAAIFWSVFEQAGSTLNLFAERSTDNRLLGMAFPGELVPVAQRHLHRAAGAGRSRGSGCGWASAIRPARPSSSSGSSSWRPGSRILIVAAKLAAHGIKVSPLWLTATYLLHTIGELCLSPVGLSAMTKLAPARVAALMMGVWFLATSVGNYLGGRVAALYESFSLPSLFTAVTLFALGATLVLGLLVRPIERMLASDK